jgi:hypothetical protein
MSLEQMSVVNMSQEKNYPRNNAIRIMPFKQFSFEQMLFEKMAFKLISIEQM